MLIKCSMWFNFCLLLNFCISSDPSNQNSTVHSVYARMDILVDTVEKWAAPDWMDPDGSLPLPHRALKDVNGEPLWGWPLLGFGDWLALLPAVAEMLAVSPPQHPILSLSVSSGWSSVRRLLWRSGAGLITMTQADDVYMSLNTSFVADKSAVKATSFCLKTSMLWRFSVRFGWESNHTSCKQ